MELEKYSKAKAIIEEIEEIEGLIEKLNNKCCFETGEEYDAYETARLALHEVISFKKREFAEL